MPSGLNHTFSGLTFYGIPLAVPLSILLFFVANFFGAVLCTVGQLTAVRELTGASRQRPRPDCSFSLGGVFEYR